MDELHSRPVQGSVGHIADESMDGGPVRAHSMEHSARRALPPPARPELRARWIFRAPSGCGAPGARTRGPARFRITDVRAEHVPPGPLLQVWRLPALVARLPERAAGRTGLDGVRASDLGYDGPAAGALSPLRTLPLGNTTLPNHAAARPHTPAHDRRSRGRTTTDHRSGGPSHWGSPIPAGPGRQPPANRSPPPPHPPLHRRVHHHPLPTTLQYTPTRPPQCATPATASTPSTRRGERISPPASTPSPAVGCAMGPQRHAPRSCPPRSENFPTTCSWRKCSNDASSSWPSDNEGARRPTTSSPPLGTVNACASSGPLSPKRTGRQSRPSTGSAHATRSHGSGPPPGIWKPSAPPTAIGHWERVFFAGLLAVIYCLRVGELESLCWGWLGTKGWFTFHDEKVNGQDTLYPLSEYMELWRAHIYAQRRPAISPAPMVGRNQYGSITPENVGGGEKGEKRVKLVENPKCNIHNVEEAAKTFCQTTWMPIVSQRMGF